LLGLGTGCGDGVIWISKAKSISVTNQTGHTTSKAGVTGRAPGIASVQFTPSDLFGAAARCLHLHLINPALVSPESRLIAALVEQHVDDAPADFFVLASADNFKDYAKAYFAGTVAAGIAYLAMIADGYTWSDHFENVVKTGPGKGNSGVSRSPDFVFVGTGTNNTALVESKGTRAATSGTFNSTVEDGYLNQVNPHLGYMVGSSTPTHGFCVGSWLTPTTKAAELNIHHTALVVATSPSEPASSDPSAVQQNNYASVFTLAHSVELGSGIRLSRIRDAQILFLEFEWIGQTWLCSPIAMPWWLDRALQRLEFTSPASVPGRYGFAIQRNIAEVVLRTVLLRETRPESLFELEPISKLGAAAREENGTVFPDGFAVWPRELEGRTKFRQVRWEQSKGVFMG
jgi:hypothetical protein